LIITSRIKLEILGHVVQSFSRKCMNVHHTNRLLYEQDEEKIRTAYSPRVWILETTCNQLLY